MPPGSNGTAVTTQSQPVTYSAYVVTDVSLGGHAFHNAQVTFTFKGDAKDIRTFCMDDPLGSNDNGVSSYFGQGQFIDVGQASVKIETPTQTVSANFTGKKPSSQQNSEVFVSFDKHNSGIGFSSYTGPAGLEPAYPLAFVNGIIGSSVGTVYPNAAALNTTFNASGYAWSCVGYPPLSLLNASQKCNDPVPLATDHGPLIVFQPYNNINTDGTLCCNFGGTLNRGTFSAVAGQ